MTDIEHAMAHAETMLELDKLKAAIQKHHDQRQDDRCWMDDAELYDAAGIPGPHLPTFTVTNIPEMRRNCDRFLRQRCIEGGEWPTYEELEKKLANVTKVAHTLLNRVTETADFCDLLRLDGIDTSELRGWIAEVKRRLNISPKEVV